MFIKNRELESGLMVTDAIHMIGDIALDKNNKASFRVDVYVDENKEPIDCFYRSFIYQGGDINKEALQSLSDYRSTE